LTTLNLATSIIPALTSALQAAIAAREPGDQTLAIY
jgi:hypothetical protein